MWTFKDAVQIIMCKRLQKSCNYTPPKTTFSLKTKSYIISKHFCLYKKESSEQWATLLEAWTLFLSENSIVHHNQITLNILDLGFSKRGKFRNWLYAFQHVNMRSYYRYLGEFVASIFRAKVSNLSCVITQKITTYNFAHNHLVWHNRACIRELFSSSPGSHYVL